MREAHVQMNLEHVHDASKIVDAVQAHQQHVGQANQLLSIPFVSVTDYLFLVSETARLIQPLQHRALFYLAAAVSDFYIPDKHMPEHKIQSRSGALQLELHQVPKFLGYINQQCAPDAFFVSFKLETDFSLLRRKAQQSIEKYGMHLVVANELHTRFKQVLLIRSDGECAIHKTDREPDIEQSIVQAVVQAHYQYLGQMIPHHDFSSSKIDVKTYRYSSFRYHPRLLQLQRFWDVHQYEILSMVLGSALSILVNMVREKLLDR